ncbi:DUF2085 domain-containing protein|uniref:DUF2085 domain-containing protein n=1 Tax=Dendrosporobacter quercicolus TaxID=146817 RepID=UPI000B83BCA5|nr:DUF2085 domain-containing protein [Dendrosporobacter quercicolus DSM 1736]
MISFLNCHRLPDRTFSINGKLMPMCARCFGAYIGHIAALLLLLSDHSPSLWVCAALIALMLIDWSLQEFLGLISTNYRRLFTGLGAGIGIGTLQWHFLIYLCRALVQELF